MNVKNSVYRPSPLLLPSPPGCSVPVSRNQPCPPPCAQSVMTFAFSCSARCHALCFALPSSFPNLPCPALPYSALPPCLALPCRALHCTALHCTVQPYPVLPSPMAFPALPYPALPCPVLPSAPSHTIFPAFRLALTLTIHPLLPFAVPSDLPLSCPPSYRLLRHSPALQLFLQTRIAFRCLPLCPLLGLLCPALPYPALPRPAPCPFLPCPALRSVTHHSSPPSVLPWHLPSTLSRPLSHPPICPCPSLRHIVCNAISLPCCYSCNTNRFVLPPTLPLAWPAVPSTLPVA